ncbi:MAG: asparagine synthetase B, partial [Candidatus Omnitrophica bacterium]|nr:asparagine synthetase B [Candidatus Omnitrophota bacterium]
MCGIAGMFHYRNSRFIEEGLLVKMRDSMVHRGPDGAGVWISSDKKVGLAHRRLAIIDLSAEAAQPMSNEDGSLWISFNGEIYNHLEVRNELNQRGTHRWKTGHSDTEVILHAFEEWGIECLEKLRGMFAFALWDAKSRDLWLVRDRLGIKPLYYSIGQGSIVFASEIKAILENPEQKRAVDEEAFFHYLSFLTAPAPQTLFEGIRKLPCGRWLRVDKDGQVTERQYWDVWDNVRPLTDSSEEDIADI